MDDNKVAILLEDLLYQNFGHLAKDKMLFAMKCMR